MFSLKIVFFFFFAIVKENSGDDLFPSECGKQQIRSRIFGGVVVNDNRHPWAAYLRRYYKKIGLEDGCGGVILNKRFILTAAHCFDTEKLRAKVILGKTNIKDKDAVKLEVEKIIKHEKFDEDDLWNDIALLKLKEEITFSDKIQPICLPKPETTNDGDLVAVGWGKISENSPNSPYSPDLREVTISEYDWTKCNNEWYDLRPSQFCAGEIGKDTCEGDSGGPLMKKINGRMTLVGITSYGSNRPCGTTQNAVYTRVSYFLSWIRKTVRRETDHNEL